MFSDWTISGTHVSRRLFDAPTYARRGATWITIDQHVVASANPGELDVPNAARPLTFGAANSRLAVLHLDGGDVTISAPSFAARLPELQPDGSILYHDVAPDTDLHYVLSAGAVKENLVLRSSAAPTSFDFHIDDPLGLLGASTTDTSGAVRFGTLIDEAHYGLAPVVASGTDGASTSGTLSVAPSTGGLAIHAAIDPAWTAARTFPVTVDPTLTITGSMDSPFGGPKEEIANYYPYCTPDGGNYAIQPGPFGGVSAANTLWAGAYDQDVRATCYYVLPARSYLQFDVSNNVPPSATITSAHLDLTVEGCFGAEAQPNADWLCDTNAYDVIANDVTAPWTAGYSTVSSMFAATGAQLAQTHQNVYSAGGFVQSLDLTSKVAAWASGANNYGVGVRISQESENYGGPVWYATTNPTVSLRPKLVIDYTLPPPPTPPQILSTTHTSNVWSTNSTASFTWSSTGQSIDGYNVVFDAVQGTDVSSGSPNTGQGTTSASYPAPDGVRFLHVAAHNPWGWSTTSTYQIQTDATLPGPPTIQSTTHLPGQPTNNNTPQFSWSAPYASGILHSSYVLDHASGTLPDTVAEPGGTSFTYTAQSDGTWYFHVRTQNGAGVWSQQAGQYQIVIVTSPPTAPSITSTTHPTHIIWYKSSTAAFSWSATGTSIDGWNVVFDLTSSTNVSSGTPNTPVGTVSGSYPAPDGVRFLHVAAHNAVGWSATTTYQIQTDSTPPPAPIVSSPTHPVQGQPSHNNSVGFAWTVSDTSGIVDSAYLLDHDGSPNYVLDLAAPGVNHTPGTSMAYLGQPDGTWYFHVRAENGAGDYGGTATYWIVIDTSPPAPVVSSSSHPDQNAWSANPNASFSWTDSDTTVDSYCYRLDTTSTTVPAPPNCTTTSAQSTTVSSIADGVNYFHVNAHTPTGGWGHAGGDYRVKIDATAPAAPTVTSSTHAEGVATDNKVVTFDWSATDVSAIADYVYDFDGAATTDPDTGPAGNHTTTTTRTYGPMADGTYYFHVRAQNGSGLWSATRHYRVIIATRPGAPDISSSTHPDQTAWYSSSSAAFSWTSTGTYPADVYSWFIDDQSATTPDTTDEGSATTASATVPDGVSYLHVRAHNDAGWSDATGHFTIHVDANHAPPSVSSSTHPDQTRAYPNNGPSFAWAHPYVSGRQDSAWVLDTDQATIVNTAASAAGVTHTTGTTASGSGLADGTWWFHVKTQNLAGLWSDQADFKVTIDTAAPTGSVPLVLSTTHVPNVGSNIREVHMLWLPSPTEATDGATGYSWDFNHSPTQPADVIADGPLGTNHAQSSDDDDGRDGLADGLWYFHIREVDGANGGPDTMFGPIVIDQTALVGLSPDLLSIPDAQSSGLGLEQFYPYDHQDLGSADGYVNLRSGNLVIRQTDANIPAQGLNVVISRTYNSQAASRDQGLGKGWVLGIADVDKGVDQAAAAVAAIDPNAPILIDDLVDVVNGVRSVIGNVVEFTDADGTTHRFVRHGGFGTRFDSPPGVDLRLRENPDLTGLFAASYDFVRPDGVTYHAEKVPALLGFPLFAWRVTRITDRNNNQLSFTYTQFNPNPDPNNPGELNLPLARLATITHTPGGAGAPRLMARFTWDLTGSLQYFETLPTSALRRTRFTYDGDHFLTSVVENDQAPNADAGRRETTFVPRPLQGDEYVASGLIDSITDPNLKATHFQYEKQAASPQFPVLRPTLPVPLWYSAPQRVTALVDRRGSTWRWAYFGATDPDYGARTTVAATPLHAGTPTEAEATAPTAGETAYRTTGRSRVSLTDYRIAGANIAEITDAGNDAGRIHQTFSWAQNRLVAKADGLGNATTMSYNDLGQLTSITEPSPNDPSMTGYSPAAVAAPVTSVLEYQFPDAKYPTTCVAPASGTGPVSTDGWCNAVADLRRVRASDSAAVNRRITDFGFDSHGNVTKVIQRAVNEPVPAYSTTGVGADRVSSMAYYACGALKNMDGPRTDVSDLTSYGTGVGSCGGYDVTGAPLTITDALGNPMSFAYSPYGPVTLHTDRDGKATTSTYDARDNLLTQTGPGGRVHSFSYDGDDRKLTETSPKGNETATVGDYTTTWTYDANGWETKRSEPLSTPASTHTEYQTAYNADGTVANTTSPTGQVTNLSYYANRALKQTDAPGDATRAVTDYAYDLAGRVHVVTSPLVNATQRPTATIDYTPDGHAWRRTELSAASNDNASAVTRTAYDPYGEVLAVVGPRADQGTPQREAHTFDAFGQETKLSRLAEVQTNRLLETTSTYDASGNLVSVSQPTGNHASLTTTYTYDADNRRVGQPTDPTNPRHRVVWTYSAEGLQLTRVDQKVTSTTPLVIVPWRTTATSYNPDNTVASEVSTDNSVTLSPPTKARCNYASSGPTSAGYDADGHPLVVRTITGTTGCTGGTQVASETMTWDEGGTLSTDIQSIRSPQAPNAPQTRAQSFTYNADRTLASFTHDGRTTAYTNAPAGWWSGLTDAASRSATATYFPSGAMKTLSVGKPTTGSPVATATWDYHRDGAVKSLSWTNAASTVVRSHTNITYDEGGQRLGEHVSVTQIAGSLASTGGDATYAYDLANRLTKWVSAFRTTPDPAHPEAADTANPVTTYTLDDGGNITHENTTTFNASGASPTDTTSTYVNGLLTSQRVTQPSYDETSAFNYSPIGDEQTRTDTGTTAAVRTTSYDPMGRTSNVTGNGGIL